MRVGPASGMESLRDVAATITGVRAEHTVPDAFVRSADQVELVDMAPEALRRRLAHGNVLATDIKIRLKRFEQRLYEIGTPHSFQGR